MPVIAFAEMFGISGRREELVAALRKQQQETATREGCNRYVFAATLEDPDTFVLLSEWVSQDALDAHYRSSAFANFQLALHGLLARPSEMTVYSGNSVRPVSSRPMDPRDAD
jgi:quinol monooxygenase YgiN